MGRAVRAAQGLEQAGMVLMRPAVGGIEGKGCLGREGEGGRRLLKPQEEGKEEEKAQASNFYGTRPSSARQRRRT